MKINDDTRKPVEQVTDNWPQGMSDLAGRFPNFPVREEGQPLPEDGRRREDAQQAQARQTALPGVQLVEPHIHKDARGCLFESFSARRLREQLGIDLNFVQDNVVISNHGVLRGLHFQRRQPQGKLVQVLEGAIYDVAVDIRPDSPHFGQHVAVELSAANHRQVWVPPGFAHGYCVTSPRAIVHYKMTAYHDPDDQGGLAWDCPQLAIPWPLRHPLLSPRDQRLPGLESIVRDA